MPVDNKNITGLATSHYAALYILLSSTRESSPLLLSLSLPRTISFSLLRRARPPPRIPLLITVANACACPRAAATSLHSPLFFANRDKSFAEVEAGGGALSTYLSIRLLAVTSLSQLFLLARAFVVAFIGFYARLK